MLQDLVIVVTGSTSGIGAGIVSFCLKQGAKIVLHGTRAENVAEKVAELQAEYGADRVTGIHANLLDRDAPQKIIGKALDYFGTLDGLVNNAGIFPRNDIGSASHDSFDTIFDVNARAPLFLCQEAVKIFKDQNKPGSIVNIGSINAHCGQTDILIYSMSKGALQTMTRNLGDALGTDKIRVNQLNVGWTYTEGEHKTQTSLGASEDWLDHVPETFAPSGTLLTPADIAHHTAFWLSPLSAPVNGSVYEIEQYPVIGRNKISG